MDNKRCQTYREQFESALACETTEEAELWMEKEVAHYVENHGETVTKAMSIIKCNIGYMAGYCDDATAKKIHRLFNAVHPIFGTATYHEDVSFEEPFGIGRKLGEAVKQKGKP